MSALSTSNPSRWLALGCVALGLSLIVLDETVVNAALPILTADLNLSAYEAEWIDSAYALAFASLLIFFGQLADRYGRKRLFLLGLAVFLAASAGVAASDASSWFILARALQGCGAAIILPTSLALINSLYQGRDRIIAFSVWGGTIGSVAALGPLVGAVLITYHSWHWAFAINVPIGCLAFVATWFCIPESRSEAKDKGFDALGAALVTFALFAVIFAIIEGGRFGFFVQREPFVVGSWIWPTTTLPITAFLAVMGLASIVALVSVEKSRLNEGKLVVINLNLFRSRSFSAGNVVALVVSLGEFGILFTLPLFLELAGGYDLLQTGIILFTMAGGVIIAAATGPTLSQRVGATRTLQLGLTLEIAGISGLALFLQSTMTGWEMTPWLITYGLGIGYATGQLAGIILSDVPSAESGAAGAFQSTSRQIGAALGTAVLGTTLVFGLGSAAQSLEAAGVPSDQAQEISQEIQDSGGEIIPELSSESEGLELVQVATEVFTTSFTSVIWVAVAILCFGLLISFLIPKNAARKIWKSQI